MNELLFQNVKYGYTTLQDSWAFAKLGNTLSAGKGPDEGPGEEHQEATKQTFCIQEVGF